MNPRPEDVDALARAIDRVVFHEAASPAEAAPAPAFSLISYLNDSFPQVAPIAGRRERVQRRLVRSLRLPRAEPAPSWGRLETELNRRLGNLDPRWTPLVGGAALLLLGMVGVAVWRQRGAIRPALGTLR